MKPRSGVHAGTVAALTCVLGTAAILAACSWPRSVPADDAAAHRRGEAPAARRLVQLDFGRAARFAECIGPACSSATPKTLAVVAPAAPSVKPASEPIVRPSQAVPLTAARTAPAPDPEPHRLVLHFAVNRASLTPSHKAIIASAMSDLRKADRVVIVGRTDDTGGEAVNQSLAFARALAIRDLLLDLAPDLPARIAIDAKGRCCYVAANDSADGRSRNRRVELVFTTPPEAAP